MTILASAWAMRRERVNCFATRRTLDWPIKATTRPRAKGKLDRLDEALLFAQSIDATSYERQRDRLREELTLAQIDHHAEAVDELDVQGILAFAERVLPRASDLWVQAA